MEKPMDEQREHLEGMSDLEGTPCFVCPEGEYQTGTATRTLEDGNTILVVKEVPALVCDKCGDAAFSETVSERLEGLLDEAAAAGVESEVRRYLMPQQRQESAGTA
jgi:YgiT-type zinc finger domain-containing protein